jgi:hypothetical protein
MRVFALLSGCALFLVPVANSGEPLTIRVRPVVARAPALLTIETTIEQHSDNRALEVVAESADFFSSSQAPLDGERAPRTSQFVFKSLPAGTYEVTATLIGTQGRRAAQNRRVLVAAGPER